MLCVLPLPHHHVSGSTIIISQSYPAQASGPGTEDSAGLPVPLDGQSAQYQAWKQQRLQMQDRLSQTNSYPPANSLSPNDRTHDSSETLKRICTEVRDTGFSLYQWNESPHTISSAVEQLHRQLSLTTRDTGVLQADAGLSLLQDLSGTAKGRFVPYTARAMGWHTDGYYNAPGQTLRCFTLHCIHPAASGGALTVVDPELLLIALYDDDPQLVAHLCHPQCMTLPANKDDVGHDRPDRHVPVLFAHTDGTLGLRFTTRTQHISWHSAETKAAAERLAELIDLHPQWHQSIRLDSGQGIITRNILHRRDAFSDSVSDSVNHSVNGALDDGAPAPARQMLRGRYLQLPTVNLQPAT